MASPTATSSNPDSSTKSCKAKVVLRSCPLGSAVGIARQAGELVAIAYPQPKAGYKNPMAYGAKPKLSTEVTSRHFVKMVRAAADSTCEKKVLMPYRPNAPRNRPKETLSNTIGKRYGTHPTSTEHYKGESHVKLSDADPESRKPWKTTNMVFQASAQVTDVVGLANAGISSDIARRMHKQQGIYSP
ncbi:hypothetical protein OEZ85_008450 [Tetradesmus obliquus]|uniref:Uncharacterized protein n=1 Tax=Tetradesmus obliquus TaxID=3088 RepID=A0ABY8TL50_TETOB|nr:hypothetical protein OEZ85_008450 [Tetradesmus obliquus]